MPASLLDRVAPEEARKAVALAILKLEAEQTAVPRRPLFPHQTPPPQPWDVWLFLGGRGSGKTEAGARYVNDHAQGSACLDGPVPHRIAIVAPSHDDAVDTCVRGETGLLQVNPRIRFRPGAALQADLTWPNGAEAELFGTFAPEDVERFRGPQHCLVWGDEFAAWRKLDEAWDMIAFGLRLGAQPKMVLTTTPKRRPKLREVMDAAATVVTRARTADNLGLPEHRRDVLYARYGGTTIGRQELDAEILDDVQGALWRREIICYQEPPARYVKGEKAGPDLVRVAVGIDPAVTSTEDSDETGIVVDGIAPSGHGYTLADLSGRMSPLMWARRAVQAYRDFEADQIVAEANNGGDLVATVIAQIDPTVPVSLVHASRSKRTRADPIVMPYEQGRWFHAMPLPELEDQMCTYTGEPGETSPDRLDAHVWAASWLLGVDVNAKTWGAGPVWGAP